MDDIWINFSDYFLDEFWWVTVVDELPFLANRIGYYGSPPDDLVIRTLDEFFHGSANLDFHAYYELRQDDRDLSSFPL